MWIVIFTATVGLLVQGMVTYYCIKLGYSLRRLEEEERDQDEEGPGGA